MRLSLVGQLGHINYKPNFEMLRLSKNCVESHENDQIYHDFKTVPFGCFEVYFMGLKMHSKLMTSKWPNIPALVRNAKKLYQDFMNG